MNNNCTCKCHTPIQVKVQDGCKRQQQCCHHTCSCNKNTCPPRKPKQHSHIVEVPQDPPFKTPTSSTPPWKQGKPKAGDPGEIPWFKGKVNDIQRKGPVFGPRKDEYLPYLLMRTAAGDRGARPFNGVFWESPDIFVVPNQDATTAPLIPSTTGGLAQASKPNTLYAHVWNLGKAPAYRVRVEFYWFNPSLGISRADANFIGAAYIDLESRFALTSQWKEMNGPSGKYLSQGSHAIVRCPETWIPSYINNGHECLVVRVTEPMFDAVNPDQFSPAQDRHVAQRNIAVVQSASPAAVDLTLQLGYAKEPSDVDVEVSMQSPNAMEWLKLYTGKRDLNLQTPALPIVSGFLPPEARGSSHPNIKDLPFEYRGKMLTPKQHFHRGCDPLQILFHASIEDMKPGQAQVLRVQQKTAEEVIGGYTVILTGKIK